MHKARENNDGTFSIGKTWMLDDLSTITSYTAFTPSSPAEQQHKQWAGNVGFVVTVGKPYYWHARTSKEKEFFIGSLVKIYRKYTGGKVPNLVGFDDRELHLLVGTPPIGPPGSARPPMPPPTRPDGPPSSHGSRPQSPYTTTPSSREASREPLSRRPVPEEHSLRAQKSRDQMGRPSTGQSSKMSGSPQPNPASFSAEPPPTRAPKIPLVPPQAAEKKFRDPDEMSMSSSFTESQPPPSRDGRAMAEPKPFLRTQELGPSSPEVKRSMDNLRPTTPTSAVSASRNATQSPASSLGQKSPLSEMKETAFIPEPLGRSRDADGPADVRDVPPAAPAAAPVIPPVPALEPEPLMDTTPKPFAGSMAAESPRSETTSDRAMSLDQSEPEQAASDEPSEAHRPGLGPMIKKKQNKEVAGAFRKAATAYGAFKPRPGGAGERLMAAAEAQKQKAEADGPDGITGVVPAPSLRPSGEAQTPENEVPPSFSSPRDTPPLSSPALEPPTVEVTQAAVEETKATTTTVTDTKKTVQIQEETRDTSRSTVKVPVDERTRSTSPSPHERNRRRRENNTMKYCQALGIDSNILEGRGVDFDDVLTDLGWNGRLGDEKRIEDLEADVRREIGRVEATSWLGNLEQQEGKVEQLAKLIEKTVEECDELDGLLTLYSHELNVSFPPRFQIAFLWNSANIIVPDS